MAGMHAAGCCAAGAAQAVYTILSGFSGHASQRRLHYSQTGAGVRAGLCIKPSADTAHEFTLLLLCADSMSIIFAYSRGPMIPVQAAWANGGGAREPPAGL